MSSPLNPTLFGKFMGKVGKATTNVLYGPGGHMEVRAGGYDHDGVKKAKPKALPPGNSAKKVSDYNPKKGYSKPRFPGPKYR